ncbi:hypothetical protein COO20_15475 [Thalassospira marina]|uniref:Methyltransferase domain-containing protein n=1 Tax=Thalassospira marina TaxID=2048283 RepID=A0A2N3KR93_9PROT|nr:hypothetical protein COO20_15475 [Thalassospira marina]
MWHKWQYQAAILAGRGFYFVAMPACFVISKMGEGRLTDYIDISAKTERLHQIIENFLALPGSDLVGNQRDILEMVDILVAITGVDLTPNSALDCHTATASGKAVSLVTAGRCALEFMRSQVFMRGCYQAICDQQNGRNPVEVLYGGTGPFGLLIIPLLPFFSADDIQVTLLDIHQPSLDYVKKLIDVLGVQDRIRTIECVDILKWPVPHAHYDVIVSETMTARLHAEPQVAIFTHLISGLKPAGALVPQEVTIDAALQSYSHKGDDALPIGRLFTLNRENVQALSRGDNTCLKCQFEAPAQTTPAHVSLFITTDICVYDGHVLGENQCSLNLPLRYDIQDVSPQSRFEVEYVMSDMPELVVKHMAVPKVPLSPVWEDQSPAGLPALVTWWRFMESEKRGGDGKAALRASVTAGQRQELMGLLNLNFPDDLARIYTCRTIEDLETLILTRNGGTISPALLASLGEFAKAAESGGAAKPV